MQAFKTLLASGLLAIAILPSTTGCTATYWREFAQTSAPQARVLERGKVTWTGKEKDGAVVYTAERKHPMVEVSLLPNSSTLTLSRAQVLIESSVDSQGFETINDILVNFNQQIPNDGSLQLDLGQIITGELLAATDPNGNPSVSDLVLLAQTTFVGRGGLGEQINWKLTIPIDIEVIDP